MDKIHLLLLLSGLCSLSSCAIRYGFSQDAKTWDEARTYCRDTHGDLATMYTLEQMQTALQAVGGQFGQGVWIGLHTSTKQNWHWSLALKDFYKDGERDYLKWGTTSTYNCGAYKKDLAHAHTCDTGFRPVCFDATEQGLQQYIFSPETMTWRDAQKYCRANHTDLVSVRNEQESQILQDVVGDQKVWIGLFKDPWIWSSKQDSSFRYWPEEQGVYTSGQVKLCATVRDDGRWEQRDCTEEHRFLCSYEKTYKHFYKVKFSSEEPSFNPNDPKVSEEILKQIKQQLKGTGVEGVQWKTQPDGKVFRKEEEPKNQEDCVL